jgi:MFS family permease
MDLRHAGAVWSTASALGLVGAVIGGYLADRYADERGRSYPIVGAIGLMLTFVGYIIGFTQTDTTVVVVALIAGSFAYNMKDGPVYAAMQNAVPSRLRSTGAAVYMFAATALGGACGPMLAGGVSDLMAAHEFHDTLRAYDAACPGGRAIAGAAASIGQACTHSAAQGVRWALAVTSVAFVIGGLFNVLASRVMPLREAQ